jgi:hypothetical protein
MHIEGEAPDGEVSDNSVIVGEKRLKLDRRHRFGEGFQIEGEEPE